MAYALPIIKRKVLYALIRNVSSMSRVSTLTHIPLDKLRAILLQNTDAAFEAEYIILMALGTFHIQREYYHYLIVEAARYCDVYTGELKLGKKVDSLADRKLLDHNYGRWEVLFYPMCKRNYILDAKIYKGPFLYNSFM